MFGIRRRAGSEVLAVASVESGGAAVAILEHGEVPQLLSLARQDVSPQERSEHALASAVLQALSACGEKAISESAGKGGRIARCYCVIGAPWTRSFMAKARSRFEKPAAVTDRMVADLARKSLADQKDIQPGAIFESNVMRVYLNGYPTVEPEGKRAEEVCVSILASDCESAIKNGAQESLARLFPDTPLVFRSSARAELSAVRQITDREECLLVEIGAEATDLLVVREGTLAGRASLPQGSREMLAALRTGKPPEETLALLELFEKDQCEGDACEALEKAIAEAEPNLAKLFGESLAKFSAVRKLPEDLVLIAPEGLSPWLSRFFSRIDFTQFTATTRPFAVSALARGEAPAFPYNVSRLSEDSALSIASALALAESGS